MARPVISALYYVLVGVDGLQRGVIQILNELSVVVPRREPADDSARSDRR